MRIIRNINLVEVSLNVEGGFDLFYTEVEKHMSNPPISIEEIERRFGYHKPTTQGTAGTAPMHAELRRRFIDFAGMLNDMLPDGRAKAVAFTELESAAMWAHKAIASLDPVDLSELKTTSEQ